MAEVWYSSIGGQTDSHTKMQDEIITLSRRLTHKYNSGWSHLDEHEILGTVKMLGERTKKEENNESFRQTVILEVNLEGEEQEPGEVNRAISDLFSRSCRCEYDCCGHMSTFAAKVMKLGGNKYGAVVCGSRNY